MDKKMVVQSVVKMALQMVVRMALLMAVHSVRQSVVLSESSMADRMVSWTVLKMVWRMVDLMARSKASRKEEQRGKKKVVQKV
jgi:hypothetical protein